MASCGTKIAIWVIMAIIITIIIFYLITIVYIDFVKTRFIDEFNEQFNEFCQGVTTVRYRKELVTPQIDGTYQRDIALSLIDISLAVSTANCQNILPLPEPPGLPSSLRIEGIDPISGQKHMYAYIFWSGLERKAVIAFTGTVLNSEWKADLDYKQVAPTALNGYTNNMLCHEGFYNSYLAVRNKLWAWWNQFQGQIDYLYITGHSLGGALSSLCAFDFATYDPIHYSFASPRVGNVMYANVFNRRLPTGIRVNNTEDIVVAYPPATWRGFTYKHTGQNVPFTTSLGSLLQDHVEAYAQRLPVCPQVAPCINN